MKQITGGDPIAARFLHKEFFEFVPVLKLWLSTNHRPVISGTDHAIWRRILLVPFTVTIPPEKRDRRLEAVLAAEAPGILNWLLRGCAEWRERGLAPPDKVRAATDQYRKDMDRVGLFLEEQCRREKYGMRTKTSLVYERYRGWCEETGTRPLARGRFRDKCTNEHGIKIVSRDGYEHFDELLLVQDGEL